VAAHNVAMRELAQCVPYHPVSIRLYLMVTVSVSASESVSMWPLPTHTQRLTLS